jgi:PKHD-type hydroxylase
MSLFGKADYWFFEKVIPKKQCNEIIKFGKKLEKEQAVVDDNKIDYEMRNSHTGWFNDPWVYEMILPFIHGANKSADWGFDFDWCEDVQFTQYKGKDKQHYNWHVDANPAPYDENSRENWKGKIRKLSCCINLSDPKDYEGGMFYVAVDGKIGIKKEVQRVREMSEQGSIIVFPSQIYHKVTPVTKGTRYSLVCWTIGPKFK